MKIKTARKLLTVTVREWCWRKEKSLPRALASFVCYRIIEKKEKRKTPVSRLGPVKGE